jgi:hypothetical protein
MSDEKNSQIVYDIQQLQGVEKELYSELQSGISSNTIRKDEKEALLSKINVLTQIRMNLYKTLNNSYDERTTNLESAQTLLDTQTDAIYMVEQELNNMKQSRQGSSSMTSTGGVGAGNPGAPMTETDSYRRLTLNNIYYAKWYAEHALIFRNIYLFVIAVGILYLSHNMLQYPKIIYNLLMTACVCAGLFIVSKQIMIARSRDNLDYDKYDWNFDIKDAPPIKVA